MRKGQCVHVLKVWTEVPAQTELCLPSQEETQDRVRERGAVCEQRTGRLHWQRKSRRQLLIASFRGRLLAQGGQCHSAPFKHLETH